MARHVRRGACHTATSCHIRDVCTRHNWRLSRLESAVSDQRNGDEPLLALELALELALALKDSIMAISSYRFAEAFG